MQEKNDAANLNVLIAGGGTGGHLFPGLALAEEFSRRGAKEIRFVGTKKGVEAREVPKAGYKLEFLEVSGIKGRGFSGFFSSVSRLPRSYWQSKRILQTFRPDLVIGVGGYASGPMVLAAARNNIPTAILEQNALPGLTNKILGRFVDRVFLYLPEASRFFPDAKVQKLGNPIRREICEKLSRVEARSEEQDKFSILLLGGSQGAKALNDLLPAALEILKKTPQVVHQTGTNDKERVEKMYQEKGIQAHVSAFFDDMALQYQNADLIICRAGATTIAELAIVGRPAVLIPFPFAADNHQEINAKSLVDAGAAILFRQSELTPEILADTIRDLWEHPEKRIEMAEAAKSVGRPNAAHDITSACLLLLAEKNS